jgi:DNA repair protein RadC
MPAGAPSPAIATVDDRRLLADLLGPTAAAGVDQVPVAALLDADARELRTLGLPSSARRRLLAAAELARRFQPSAAVPSGACERPQHFLPHLEPLRASPVEVLGVLTLDARLGLLGDLCRIASGAVMHVGVTAREVFAPAIHRRAVAIVLAHNHPSGDPEPSPQDRAFTNLMSRAGAVLGIQVLDHLVVTRRSYFSFAEARLIPR